MDPVYRMNVLRHVQTCLDYLEQRVCVTVRTVVKVVDLLQFTETEAASELIVVAEDLEVVLLAWEANSNIRASGCFWTNMKYRNLSTLCQKSKRRLGCKTNKAETHWSTAGWIVACFSLYVSDVIACGAKLSEQTLMLVYSACSYGEHV